MTGRLQSISLVDQAIAAMREQISSGAWPVGSRIPTGGEFAADLAIGRNSLREAVRALVHAGLLETRQGDGTYVRATSDLAGALRRWTKRQRLIEVVEVRRALEVEAARLAALRRTDAEADDLERVLDARARAWRAGEREAFVDLDVQLHSLIAAASQNEMLAELYADLAAALREVIEYATVDARDEADLHDELVRAIRAGDPEAARRATVKTLDGLIERLADETS